MTAQMEIEAYRPSWVPVEGVNHVWSKVSELLEPAVERSGKRWRMEQVYHAIQIGHYHLWVVFGPRVDDKSEVVGAVVTQIVEYPGCRMLAYQFLGGEGFEEWFEVLDEHVSGHAREAGCAGTEATARFGFKPFLKRIGYRDGYAVYDKYFEESSHE